MICLIPCHLPVVLSQRGHDGTHNAGLGQHNWTGTPPPTSFRLARSVCSAGNVHVTVENAGQDFGHGLMGVSGLGVRCA